MQWLLVVMAVASVLSFSVLTAVAGAERRARHACLEALAVVLLATRLAAIAALEVVLALHVDCGRLG